MEDVVVLGRKLVSKQLASGGLVSLVVAAALVGSAAPASAYAEDVCTPLSGDGWRSCTSILPAGNLCPADAASPPCSLIGQLTSSLSGVTRIALQVAGQPGSRSTIHMDATYYLAQAAGFTPRQSYFIAAYDETVDLTEYVHRDQNGEPYPDPKACVGIAPPAVCALQTASLPGFSRNNFEVGGVFLHFMAPFAASASAAESRLPVVPLTTQDTGEPPAGLNGVAPALTDDRNETMVSDVRRWALGQGPLCVAGFTQHAVTGQGSNDCYHSPTRPVTTLDGRIPFIEQLTVLSDVNWTTKLGEMQISGKPGEQQVPASRIGDLVGEANAPLARIGTYLHVLQDRISHHVCNVSSYVVGPRPDGAPKLALNPVANDIYQTLIAQNPGAISRQKLITDPDLVVYFDRKECDQANHEARHDVETGRDQGGLPAEEQTTEPGLLATYSELRMFARSAVRTQLTPIPKADSPSRATSLVDRLVQALESPDPQARLDALTEAGKENCLLPLPGYGGWDYAQWSSQADRTSPHCATAARATS